MLHSIPIYAVMVENLGERGAYYTALRLLQQEVHIKHQVNDSVSSSSTATTATTVTDNIPRRSSSEDSMSDVYSSSIVFASTVVTACLAVVGMYYYLSIYTKGNKK